MGCNRRATRQILQTEKILMTDTLHIQSQSQPQPPPRRAGTIIYLLAASVALMMTGFGIIMPVFARRLGEFGDGVAALGWMAMAFSLSQMIAAPFAGALADRYGRRPIVLVSLAAFALTNVGYLLAASTGAFIGVRFVGGLLTAGLFPAAMAIVADIVPEDERGKWIGMVMGGYAVGMVFGPAIGGVLYDGWGFAAPFVTSAGLALAALIFAALLVPETLPPRESRQSQPAGNGNQPASRESVWQALPRPLAIFATLLFVDFVMVFSFAFIEPQMVFYFYDDLGWSTTQFGVVVGAYGLAMVVGQTALGQLSDRFGRRPMMLLGILFNFSLFVTMAFFTSFPVYLTIAAVSGLGVSLFNPAINAYFLDITAAAHRSRVMGIKESALGLGGVLGP
ncbi:MAG: MFS transporter, partial [Chloroflexi bacterium]